MADTEPGQQWRHGWIPLTAAAAKSKNHGKKPGKNSALSRIIAEAAEAAKTLRQNAKSGAGPDGTPPPKWTGLGAGKAPTKTPVKAPEKPATPKAAPPKAAPAKPATKAPASTSAKTPTKPATKPAKPGAKAGTDSHGKTLRVGDQVRISGGEHSGKNAHVTGKSGQGKVKVQLDGGGETTVHSMNVRSRADHDTSRAADNAIRAATGRPSAGRPPAGTSAQPVEVTQGQIRDVYNQLAAKPRDAVSIARIRDRLGSTLDRAHVDRAIKGMIHMPGVSVMPEHNQKTLTPKIRAGAVVIGDQDMHLISIDAP